MYVEFVNGSAVGVVPLHIARRRSRMVGKGRRKKGDGVYPHQMEAIRSQRGRPRLELLRRCLFVRESSFVISRWCGGSGRHRISGGFQAHFPTDLYGSLFSLRKPHAHLLHSYLSPLPSAKMTRRKGMITPEDLASLRLRYHIPDHFELLAPSVGETFRSHREGYVCLNEWMFKTGVRIPLDLCVLELLNASLLSRKVMLGDVSLAGKRNMKIVLNLPDSWNNELSEVRGVAVEELERGQRAALEVLQSHSLKWYSAKGAFLWWCEGLPLSRALSEPSHRELGGTVGHSLIL
ncbi:hypothetical protein ACLOJK_034508 [Asimina triloba]